MEHYSAEHGFFDPTLRKEPGTVQTFAAPPLEAGWSLPRPNRWVKAGLAALTAVGIAMGGWSALKDTPVPDARPEVAANPSATASARPSDLPENIISDEDKRAITRRFEENKEFWRNEGVEVDDVKLVFASGTEVAADCDVVTAEGPISGYCPHMNTLAIGAANFNSWAGGPDDTQAALDGVVNHEFGHVVTYETTNKKWTVVPTARQIELQAQCYSGIFTQEKYPDRVNIITSYYAGMDNGIYNGVEFREYFLQGARAAESTQTTRDAMAACAFDAIPDDEAQPLVRW
jgi:hypothetical protein